MKQKLSLLFTLMLSTLMASAQTVEVDGITYNLISKGKIAEVTSSSSHSGDVVIPEIVTYNGESYKVTTINKNAFANCSFNSIEIPSSITKICQEAFYNGKATSVKIKDLAAWCNINFESYFKTNPLSTASHLFLNDEEIHDLVIPDGVKTITNNAFYYFSGLTSVKIPSSVTNIGTECFAYCTGIKTIEIGDNTSQETATVVGMRAFYKCNNVESIVLGNNIVKIGSTAFEDCDKVHSVVIPNSVRIIENSIFAGCDSLESVQLPENLQSIARGVFVGCTNLKSIAIPDGVELLGESAFDGCTSLTEVKLPRNLKKIDWCVFQNCTSLTSIDIPDNTQTIYVCAFDGCSNLKTVTLGKSVQNIQNGAFANCPALEDVYCKSQTPPTCYTAYNNLYAKTMDVFYNSYAEYITLHVPEASYNAYKTTSTWSGFGNIVTMDEPVVDKCATPTISYVDGKLTFDCETEGVEYVSSITPPSAFNSGSKTVSMPTTYKVTVYATKDGYENSDVATKDINVSGGASGIRGDVNNDGQVSMPDAMFIVNKILNGKFPDE